MRSSMELLEFVPGALYLVSGHAAPPPTSSPLRVEYIHVENAFPYQSFYLDFGPLHLAHIAAFAQMLDEKVQPSAVPSTSRDDNQHDADTTATRVCVYTSMAPQHRANAACLLGCWAILVKKWTAERAFAPFAKLDLPPFHDASPNVDRFGLSVFHVLRGLERAIQSGLFPADIHAFDDAAFLGDMDPDARDLTWVTPRVAAFAGPQSQQNWFGRAKSHEYVEYFRARGVGAIVRLNKPKYDKQIFTRAGIDVVDLYFPDGTCPPTHIVSKFLELCAATTTHTKIAVHCRAGLGRTGTLIACHLMRAFQFSAEEAIGWLRLCRPGSVVGAQQHFLRELEPRIRLIDAVASITTKSGGQQASPEDLGVVIDDGDDDQQQQQQQQQQQPLDLPPRTKGIATRRKDVGAASASPTTNSTQPPSSLLPPRPTALLLPPRIPGRRVTGAPPTGLAAPASQGDLLLLRKHAQHMPLPLGASLWPQAPSVGGD